MRVPHLLVQLEPDSHPLLTISRLKLAACNLSPERGILALQSLGSALAWGEGEPRTSNRSRSVAEDNGASMRAPKAAKKPRGGDAVKSKYGPDFFREIGRKGGEAIRDRGVDHLREIGRLGGQATMQRHGAEHYAQIGRKGGQQGRGQPKPGAGRTRRTQSPETR